IVAFSGGVDSTLLLALARETLGRERVLAVTADSPSLAQADREEACRLARALDVEHLVVETAETENPAYQANTASRCYFCKQELFERLAALARQRGTAVILYGAIGDDLRDERPGALAASEYGARAPLQEAGLSKRQVRDAARRLNLPNWDRPQNACLSSRIPHGLDVTHEKLRAVERAEAVLSALGFRQVRVRHLGAHARIEVGPEEVERFQDAGVRRHVAQRLTALGFHSVGVDRAGYRAGGANRQAPDELELAA
ncbi:MAG: ATP-dependent sacrificial sulfur transferase LarE, partial [Candidatus Omnitrophica bacterium]|nr:ATP-dependent sacrificial sulfur transferase LarE [Candidatus Omnitrophota bacterium]